jgi:hypothetical protein
MLVSDLLMFSSRLASLIRFVHMLSRLLEHFCTTVLRDPVLSAFQEICFSQVFSE